MQKWALAALLFALAGCTSQIELEKYVPSNLDMFARRYLTDIAAGNLEHLRGYLDPEINNARSDSVLLAMRPELQGRVPTHMRVVGYHANYSRGRREYRIDYEGRNGAEWILYEMYLRGEPQALKVAGVHIERRASSLEDENKLSLSRKPFRNYLFGSAAILDVLFILYAVVLVFRTPMLSRWKWVLACILGFGRFQFNWTTGTGDFQLLSVQVFGVGLDRVGVVGPWILDVAVPIGAMLFVIRRRSGMLRPPPLEVAREQNEAVDTPAT